MEGVESVRIRSLTELERSQNESFPFDPESGQWEQDRANLQTSHLIWLSLVDSEGSHCYSLDQLPNIANLPEKITGPILQGIRQLRNGHAKKND